jgi:hypothetical protein
MAIVRARAPLALAVDPDLVARDRTSDLEVFARAAFATADNAPVLVAWPA